MKKKTLIIFGVIIILLGTSIYLSLNKSTLPEILIDKTWNCEQTGEVLKFHSNRKITFYNQSSGNAVDDFDLCSKYKFDEKNNIISFKCSKKANIKNMELISAEDDKLIIEYRNELKMFILNN